MNDTKLRAALKEALHEVGAMMVELAGAGSDEHILKEAREAGLAASIAILDIALDLAAPVLPPAPIAPVRLRSVTASLAPSQRVRLSEAALKERGGRRMPSGYLQPAAAQALAQLVASGYAPSPVAVISKALLSAAA